MQKTAHCGSPTILIPVLDKTSELQSCLTDVAGLPLIRRVAMMVTKAGLGNPLVVSSTGDAQLGEALAGTGSQLIACTMMDVVQACNAPILLLEPNCLPNRDFFMNLGQKQIEPGELFLWPGEQAMLLGLERSAVLLHQLPQANCFAQLVEALTKMDEQALSQKSPHEQAGISIRHADDCLRAENMLLSGLVKVTEGWMALHINRKISLAVTQRLMHTSVTPNHMTWVSMMLGLMGAAFFLSPEYGMQIGGAVLFLLHSILDGCDGELARLKFMESRLGGILDFWSDNIVHVAVFAAMGMGWAARSPDLLWPGICAVLAVVGTAMSASLVYSHTMYQAKKAGPLYTSVSTSENKSAVVRIADMLSRRDFIYLVLALALLDQTHWFLVMTAIGAPIYALLLIGIMVREKPPA
ncbi:MAG: CDP-alcohol phosphatidyltransferase family protein [Mariprofundus sp.]|nr:CDP-alcohol phosphatidyltransferase family protein [Mariprofundus sp.]